MNRSISFLLLTALFVSPTILASRLKRTQPHHPTKPFKVHSRQSYLHGLAAERRKMNNKRALKTKKENKITTLKIKIREALKIFINQQKYMQAAAVQNQQALHPVLQQHAIQQAGACPLQQQYFHVNQQPQHPCHNPFQNPNQQ